MNCDRIGIMNGGSNISIRPKPFLKWAGGKSRLASEIASFFPEQYNDYYEPFLGSGAIYFEIAPQHGILNDLNANLINTYETIKCNPRGLLKELAVIEMEYNGFNGLDGQSDYYYAVRERYNHKEMSDLEKAALFIFLNKAGWNGMYRENSVGEFNIPFGKRTRISICDKKNIMSVSKNIQKMKFTSLDYKEAVCGASEGDLVYFDPPYFPISKTASFTDYQKAGFTERDQMELYDLAVALARKGCYVVISNSDCEKVEKLYKDFTIKKVKVSRTIGAKVSTRGTIYEIVALSY